MIAGRPLLLGPGVPLALGSVLLFGASTPLAKMMLGSIDLWLLAGILYLGAGLGLSIVHLARHGLGLPTVEAPLRGPDLHWLAGIMLLRRSGPSVAHARARTHRRGERLAPARLGGPGDHGDRLAGVSRERQLPAPARRSCYPRRWDRAGLGWQRPWQPRRACVAGACVCWGIDNNLTRKLSGSDPLQIAALKGLVAGSINLGAAFAGGALVPTWSPVLAAGLVGFLVYGVSLALFVAALCHLGAAQTCAHFALAPSSAPYSRSCCSKSRRPPACWWQADSW